MSQNNNRLINIFKSIYHSITSKSKDKYNKVSLSEDDPEQPKFKSSPRKDNYDKYEKLQIKDLDIFYQEVYEYYYHKGLKHIFIRSILDLITGFIVIHFFFFCFFIVNWSEMISECSASNEVNKEECSLIHLIYKHSNIVNVIFRINIASFLYSIYFLYYAIYVLKYFDYLVKMKKIKNIYESKLNIDEEELENLTFNHIINRLIILQEKENYCRIKDKINKFDIISRIMRKDNYINMVLSNRLINFDINVIPFKSYKVNFLTQYSIQFVENCFTNYAFENESAYISTSFYSIYSLRIRIIKNFIFELIFILPFLTLKISMWLFRNVESFSSSIKKKSGSNDKGGSSSSNFITEKGFSPNQIYLFRCYNELNDRFDSRVSQGLELTKDFTGKFGLQFLSILFNFVSLISGALVFAIILISLLDDTMLNKLKIGSFNLLYIAVIIGVVSSYSNSHLLPHAFSKGREYLSCPIEQKISTYINMIDMLINLSNKITDREEFSKKNKQIKKTFDFAFILFIKEILSVMFLPILAFKLYFQAENIQKYIKYNTMKVDGLGDICSFSALEIEQSFGSNNEKSIVESNWSVISKKFLFGLNPTETESNLFNFRKQLYSIILYYVSIYIKHVILENIWI